MKHLLLKHRCTLPCLLGHILVPLLLSVWTLFSVLSPTTSTTDVRCAFWAAAIPAIISAVGGYIASKQAGKKSSTTKQLEQQQLDASKFLVPFGQNTLTQGRDALQAPLGFYSQLAHGDRNALLQSVSPELQSRDASDRATLRSVSELAPRGGGSSDFLAKLPFQRNTDTANMLFGARKAGNEGMLDVGTRLASIGSSALGSGAGIGANQLNFGLNSNRQQFDEGTQTGQSIFQLVKAFTDAWGQRTGSQSLPTNTSVWGQSMGNWTPTASTVTPGRP